MRHQDVGLDGPAFVVFAEAAPAALLAKAAKLAAGVGRQQGAIGSGVGKVRTCPENLQTHHVSFWS